MIMVYYAASQTALVIGNLKIKKVMPLSITVHYAVADGYQVGLFFEKSKTGISAPESWI